MSTFITEGLAQARTAELIRQAEAAALVRQAKAARRRARKAQRAATRGAGFPLTLVGLHRAIHA
ncbi:MAG TPA: hypothetical protein VN108_00980 [Marmoricola sp.]|nr:hypothetical protein [Marmoricola sp.]